MKERTFYAFEGFILTYAGYHWFQQAVLPLMVACVGAVLTVFIQHYLKRYLQKKDANRELKIKQNGRHDN